MTLTMAVQDAADGTVDLDENIRVGRNSSAPLREIMQITALGDEGYRLHMTSLVNRIGQNAQVFGLRLDALADMAGLQATAMRVVRGSDGGPAFEGYATPRDMMRMTLSLSRAFPTSVDDIFGPATGNIQGTHIWIYDGGICLLSANGPHQRTQACSPAHRGRQTSNPALRPRWR